MNTTRRYRSMAVLLAVLHLGACTTWKPSPVAPRPLIEEERPPTVRVVKLDGASLVVDNPRIVGDSIAVVSGQCRALSGRAGRYSCPTTGLVSLEDVRAIEVRAPRTVLAATVMGLGLGFVIVALLMDAGMEGWEF